MRKFTVEECRRFLGPEENAMMSDAEVEALRDDLYALACVSVTASLDHFGSRRPVAALEEERP